MAPDLGPQAPRGSQRLRVRHTLGVCSHFHIPFDQDTCSHLNGCTCVSRVFSGHWDFLGEQCGHPKARHLLQTSGPWRAEKSGAACTCQNEMCGQLPHSKNDTKPQAPTPWTPQPLYLSHNFFSFFRYGSRTKEQNAREVNRVSRDYQEPLSRPFQQRGRRRAPSPPRLHILIPHFLATQHLKGICSWTPRILRLKTCVGGSQCLLGQTSPGRSHHNIFIIRR